MKDQNDVSVIEECVSSSHPTLIKAKTIQRMLNKNYVPSKKLIDKELIDTEMLDKHVNQFNEDLKGWATNHPTSGNWIRAFDFKVDKTMNPATRMQLMKRIHNAGFYTTDNIHGPFVGIYVGTIEYHMQWLLLFISLFMCVAGGFVFIDEPPRSFAEYVIFVEWALSALGVAIAHTIYERYLNAKFVQSNAWNKEKSD